jgi:glycosyltransferase involved in cell wall biosynthesis
LGNRPDLPALAAATKEEWIEAVARLLGDPAERQRLGSAGRRYVETHHSWESCLAPMTDLLGLASSPRDLAVQTI